MAQAHVPQRHRLAVAQRGVDGGRPPRRGFRARNGGKSALGARAPAAGGGGAFRVTVRAHVVDDHGARVHYSQDAFVDAPRERGVGLRRIGVAAASSPIPGGRRAFRAAVSAGPPKVAFIGAGGPVNATFGGPALTASRNARRPPGMGEDAGATPISAETDAALARRRRRRHPERDARGRRGDRPHVSDGDPERGRPPAAGHAGARTGARLPPFRARNPLRGGALRHRLRAARRHGRWRCGT